jgi:probable rRNA maturation factor
MTVALFLRNEAGPRGIPAKRSFQGWIGAIPALKRRPRVEINLLLVGAREGRRFNRQFRGRDYATNVLSFPHEPMTRGSNVLLGDIVICAPVVAREAAEQGKPIREHYAHLTVHGVLHLLGHDHDDDADAERMEKLERRILRSLGIGDPYVDRDPQPAAPRRVGNR